MSEHTRIKFYSVHDLSFASNMKRVESFFEKWEQNTCSPDINTILELYKVLRYNHFSLKGDLQAKKEILLALGEQLEPKRKQLSCIASDLADNIFFMLNNLHLRHNNKVYGDKNYRKVVADMDDSTLEHWYDELYQMILLAFLQLDQVDRNAKILELKQTISSK